MKLLLIVDDYLPHSIKVAARMMHELAMEFVNKGHQVSVLTPVSNLSTKFLEETSGDVHVLFFKTGEIKNATKFNRAINETLLSYRSWTYVKPYFRKNKYDAIIYYSPSIFWGQVVGKLKRLWGAKTYLILRDVFPQWAVDNGLIHKGSMAQKYFSFFEKINYKHADHIGVMSPSNLKYFKERLQNISKFEVLYNWSKIEKPKEPTTKFRDSLHLRGKVVFFYGGNIGHAQNMMNLIRLAVRFKNNQDVHFLFVGKGDEVSLILNEKAKQHLDNITYAPPVNQDTYFDMMNEFDVGLFSLHPHHQTHNFPGKLLGYMSQFKPILGSVNTGNDLKEIVNESKSGFIFDSGEDEKLYKAALSLSKSASMRLEMGKNGNILLKKQFSVEKACSQIEHQLSD